MYVTQKQKGATSGVKVVSQNSRPKVLNSKTSVRNSQKVNNNIKSRQTAKEIIEEELRVNTGRPEITLRKTQTEPLVELVNQPRNVLKSSLHWTR